MSTSSGNAKKARLRFTYNDDLVLLREFVRENPFLVPGDDGWDVLRRNVEILTGKGFTLRTLKQHLILLIELWLKKDKIDNVRSGIEGTCSEKDTLLQEVSSLCREHNFVVTAKRKRTSRESQLLELGKEARINYAIKFSDDKENEIATEEEMCLDVQNEEEVGYSVDDHNYSQSSNGAGPEDVVEPFTGEKTITKNVKTAKEVLVPSRQRRREPLRKHSLMYLTEKAQREAKIRTRELDVEERKIELQERQMNLEEQRLQMDKEKLALEIEERREKLELQKQQLQIMINDKEVTNNIIQAQQQLIESLLKQK